jgi:hypothetical protein
MHLSPITIVILLLVALSTAVPVLPVVPGDILDLGKEVYYHRSDINQPEDEKLKTAKRNLKEAAIKYANENVKTDARPNRRPDPKRFHEGYITFHKKEAAKLRKGHDDREKFVNGTKPKTSRYGYTVAQHALYGAMADKHDEHTKTHEKHIVRVSFILRTTSLNPLHPSTFSGSVLRT